MKSFAALMVVTVYFASEVEAGDNACEFHKKKELCENATPKGKYNLKNSSDSDCECECKWSENNNKCVEGQEFFKNNKRKFNSKNASITERGCEWKPCD